MDPFWEQNRPKIVPRRVLRPLLFENVDSHETSAGVVFGAFSGPQDGAKIDPRSPQDGLKTDLKCDRFSRRFFHRFLIVLDLCCSSSFFDSIFDRFGIDLGAALASQMGSAERMDSGQIGTWAVQDALGIVLVRSFFRLAIRDHFFEPPGCLLDSFGGASGLVLGSS